VAATNECIFAPFSYTPFNPFKIMDARHVAQKHLMAEIENNTKNK
jgi:hypothetical protein